MLSTKVLAQAANKNTKFMFPKTDVAFFLSMVSEVTVQKIQNKHFLGHCPLVIGFWTVTSNHQVNKYWASADLLFSIKNIMRD